MARWVYYRLQDKAGRTIGFMREWNHGTRQFAELYGRTWLWQPIPYYDRIRIEPPEALHTLGKCH